MVCFYFVIILIICKFIFFVCLKTCKFKNKFFLLNNIDFSE